MDTSAPDTEGGIRRACDQCRLRKIRCDKSFPCSNCRAALRSCSSTGLGQKPREARQRVLISAQYEKKIDHFEDRLRGIEDLLRRLTTSLESRTGLAPLPPRNSESATPANVYDDDGDNDNDDDGDDGDDDDGDDGPEGVYEGTSSLSAQTALASEFLEDAVEKTSLRDVSPEMKNALSSLRQIVRIQQRKSAADRVRFPHQKPLPPGGFRDLPMPPVQAVVPLLRELKDKSPDFLRVVGVFVTVDDFTDHCRKVYFATQDFNLATFIVVNAGLFYLFEEICAAAGADKQPGAADSFRYLAYCRDNLETCLANLPLFAPARRDYIQAHVFGAAYALEASRPSLAWRLNCAAIHLCVALGYHRCPPDSDTMLFWFAYMFDRALVMRLGRASAVADHDVVLPDSFAAAPIPEPWNGFLLFALRHAEIQGRAHQLLYSPAAAASAATGAPDGNRADSARLLAREIRALAAAEADVADRFDASLPAARMDETAALSTTLILKSDQLSYWSTLTLIYRAIPSESGHGRFNPDCVAAARAAFQVHKECLLLTRTNPLLKTKYIHWAILYSPFMPFIVLFCHVIETSDTDDLQRLSDFVASLQQSCGAAPAIDNLHRLCQVLCRVAAVYIEAKVARQRQDAAGDDIDTDLAPIGHDFDMYLTQLKLLPHQAAGSAAASASLPSVPGTGPSGSNDMADMAAMAAASDQALQLGVWFSGGNNMMGLLEEDLSMLESDEWPSGVGGY